MQANSELADGYLRRVYVASARRATRSLLRAVGIFLLAVGGICLAIVALGWAAA